MPSDQAAAPLSHEDVKGLLSVGAALSAERDLDRLLAQILGQCRRILSADAGSLYLAEETSGAPSRLRFKLAQNDSVPLNLEEFTFPLDCTSLVGYVAVTRSAIRLADVYDIPAHFPFRFNREPDRKTGYRSKSLLSVPMLDHRDRLIGVVQLWNKKKEAGARLAPENVAREVIPFAESDHALLASLAAQAAVAIENARLYADIERLFEGFVRASVKAIESRDPTTSGHSERVASLTLALAEAVSLAQQGPYAHVTFSAQDMREIKYAALLHDFGKIGVREAVLVKAKKLHPSEMEAIRYRSDILRRTIELEVAAEKIDHLAAGGRKDDAAWERMEKDLRRRLEEISGAIELIQRSDEPALLPEGASEGLSLLAKMALPRPDGTTQPLLTGDEASRLAIPKGSLSAEERHESDSHVSHTYEYLSHIPWTPELRRVSHIAHAHHEKLDGSGYPKGIRSAEIPLPSKIMAVADIFDALSASDRPYKKAVPVPRALDILKMEADEGKLDPELVRLFIEERIYERTTPGP